jgi:hypothetical protein
VLPDAWFQRCYVHYADIQIMPTFVRHPFVEAALAA